MAADTARERGFGRIVVGVDGSPASLAALHWAAEEGRLRESEVVVVRAWASRLEMLAPYASRLNRPSFDDERRQAETELGAWIETALATVPDIKVRAVLAYGPPAKVLINQTHDADLLVLGGHRAESVLRHTVGAVAATCLRRSPCPVVIIAPDSRTEPHAQLTTG